jgi:hypothetical protein
MKGSSMVAPHDYVDFGERVRPCFHSLRRSSVTEINLWSKAGTIGGALGGSLVNRLRIDNGNPW